MYKKILYFCNVKKITKVITKKNKDMETKMTREELNNNNFNFGVKEKYCEDWKIIATFDIKRDAELFLESIRAKYPTMASDFEMVRID